MALADLLRRLPAGLRIADFLRPSALAWCAPPDEDGAGDGGGDGEGDGKPDDAGDGADELVTQFGEKAAAEIRRLRAENAKHRTSARDAQTKLGEIEKAQLSKEEQAEARAAAAEQAAQAADERAKSVALTADIKVHAAAQGAVDVDAVVALIDRSKVSIDDEGNVTGGKSAVEALLKAKPYLVAPGGPQGRNGANFGDGSGDRPPTGDMNAAIRRQAGRG